MNDEPLHKHALIEETDNTPPESHPCENCRHQSFDLSDERLKLLTDRLDAIHGCLHWICSTASALLTSINNPIAKNIIRKAMQGQNHAD